MSRKRYTPEQIIGLLGEAEVLLSRGVKSAQVCRRLGLSEQSCGTSCWKWEIVYSLREAQVLSERGRIHDNTRHNTRRLHSALGYQPPTPEAA